MHHPNRFGESCMRIKAYGAMLWLFAIILIGTSPVQSQSDKDLKSKQSTLKQAAQENAVANRIINTSAEDKLAPSLSAFGDTDAKTTGYDFTQVKGFKLSSKSDYDRIDELFRRASELGFFKSEYVKNGTFPVAESTKPGTAQIRGVEVYYVRSNKAERDNLNAADIELLEVRVDKLLTIPEKDEAGTDEEEESGGRRRRSKSKSSVSAYKLAGSELLTCIGLIDESLKQDLLARRSQEAAISLPPDLATDYTKKRGPFVVQGDRQLNLMKNIFRTFWNKEDSVFSLTIPVTTPVTGQLAEIEMPVILPENKILIRNSGNEALKITSVVPVGENADQFTVVSKLPMMIEKQKQAELEVKFAGLSPYETFGTISVQAKEANLAQEFEVVANPGIQPIDAVVLDASLFGVELRSPARASFAPNWNLGFKFGNDELNMPRWSSGMGALYVGFKNDVHVGLILPMSLQDGTMPTPLAFNTGLLASPMGYMFDFDFSFGFPFSLGGSVVVTNKFDATDRYAHLNLLKGVVADDKDYNNDFFNIATAAKLFYPVMFKDNENEPNLAFRLELGGGYMQINRNHVALAGETGKEGVLFGKNVGKMFSLGKEKDVFDVYFRISLINLGSKHNYGLGLQYFNGGMMTDAWLELTQWLRVEMKYAFLLRSSEIWESETSYFLISPRFRFGFPSIFN